MMNTAQETFALWGGTATVAVTRPDRLATARAAVEKVIDAVDAACSAYRPDSELARVNAAGGALVHVSGTFMEVLQATLRAAEITDGLLDPTALTPAPASRIHPTTEAPSPAVRPGDHFPTPRPHPRTSPATTGPEKDPHLAADRPEGTPHLPSQTHAASGGWRAIRIDEVRMTVSVPAPLRLDFGAIGKAYAADRAAALAVAEAGCGVLVALGGDITVAGPVPVGGWPVRVSDDHRPGPNGELPPGQDILLRAPGGLATSSLTVRTRRTADGRTVGHVVDPRSGMPVRGPWRTVSVSAGNCVDANSASTAALVRGLGAGGWLATRGLPSRLVHADGWAYTIAGWPDDHSERPGVKVAG